MRFARARHREDARPARWIGALLIAVSASASAADGARLTDRIVAIVNDEVITLSEVKARTDGQERRLRQEYDGAALDRRLRQLEYETLTELIERRLQMQLAKERGHEATEEEVQRA